jgi:long-chain acyl-CoA synthetase
MVKNDIFGHPGSVEVGPEPAPGESRARRLRPNEHGLTERPWEGLDTTYDIITYCAKTHAKKDAVGWRDIVDQIEEEKEVTKVVGGKEVKEKKKWKYFQLSDYKYLSFEQFHAAVNEVARGLLELGIKKEDVFNVYASTRYGACPLSSLHVGRFGVDTLIHFPHDSIEWQLITHGCAAISTPVATAYDSLGEDGLTHSLNEPECVGIFTNAELLPTVVKVAPKVPSLRVVIYDGKPKADVLESLRGVREGFKVLHIDELRELGKAQSEDSLKARLPSSDDIVLIMYTSGTTGAPKGVIIRHSNLAATVGAIYGILGQHLKKEDTYLAYLPLAHILEFVIELALMFVGMTLGYGRVKTLTDASVRNCKGDIAAYRPSILVGVPAVWEMIRKGIIQKVAAGGALKQKVFNGAMTIKKANVPGLTQVVDAAVLAQVKAATGGRLRLALSGGAALSRETQEFLSLALVTVLQGTRPILTLRIKDQSSLKIC